VRQFIITCDDCGLSVGINEAAAELHEKGIANSASVMTNFPAASHALALFARYPGLQTGVHLNLTNGTPLTLMPPNSYLVDSDGQFRSRVHLFANALLAQDQFLRDVECELDAQIGYFTRYNIQPQHLTTHMHFHVVPALRQIVIKLADRYHIPWIRSFHAHAPIVPYTNTLRRQLLTPDVPRRTAIPTPDYLAGLYFWLGYHPEKLSAELIALDGITEIVVHPGRGQDSSYPADVPYAPHKRAAEMRYLERLYPLLQ
jgi:hypothetical protein